jgi:hypothetical protein
MKITTINLGFACSMMVLGGTALAAEQLPPPTPVAVPVPAKPLAEALPAGAGPKITFSTKEYDFGKVKAGDPVKYSYIFTNTGDAVLEVTHVQPSCGCTTAGDWTHKVEPGQTGTIPIQFNSGNANGAVAKTVTVTSNDKAQPSIALQIKGTVWKPIEVTPAFAFLNVPADSSAVVSTVVRIVNNTDEPFTMSAPEINNKSFTAEIKTNQLNKEYQLVIATVPPMAPGSVQAQITIKTTSTNAPVLSVTAMANVQPPVTISPPQITLPAAPLAAKTAPTITIINNGTNNLKLSDAVVSVKDVEVQVQETQPGKTFTATLSFPPGFELTQGQQAEFTIKSSHPSFPVIKVPITQMPRVSQPLTPVKPGDPHAALTLPPPTPVRAGVSQ